MSPEDPILKQKREEAGKYKEEILNESPPSEKLFKVPEGTKFDPGSSLEQNFNAWESELDSSALKSSPAQVEYRYPVERVADSAVAILAAQPADDWESAADQAIRVLDLCRTKLYQRVYHEKLAGDSYAMSLIPFGKAVREVTGEARAGRADDKFSEYWKEKRSGDALAGLKLEIWKIEGMTPIDIKRERDKYRDYKALSDHKAKKKAGSERQKKPRI